DFCLELTTSLTVFRGSLTVVDMLELKHEKSDKKYLIRGRESGGYHAIRYVPKISRTSACSK
ncbi:MAG TPA: hypothetical protein PKN72_09885, partial [Nitrosomonas europaea]|nr:hypothetical protein [Nitrosomonas europaea]